MVAQYEKAVILRLGCIRKGGAAGPGLFFFLPCVDEIHVVDMRTISFDVPPQEVMLYTLPVYGTGWGDLSLFHIRYLPSSSHKSGCQICFGNLGLIQ